MLEPIREFALERLEQRGEAGTMRIRHATRFLAVAEEAAPRLTRGLRALSRSSIGCASELFN